MKHKLKTYIGTFSFLALASTAPAQVAGDLSPDQSAQPSQPSQPSQSQNPQSQPPQSQTPQSQTPQSQTPQSQPPQSQTSDQARKAASDDPSAKARDSIGAAKASDLIGMDVVDSQGEKLGSVDEIAVDVESGRIVQVILSSGGFLGIASSETAVPPGALVHDAENERLQLGAGEKRLENAPSFDNSEWSEAFTTERLTASYKHYGQESSLNFVNEADRSGDSSSIPSARLNHIQRASEINGMTVENNQDETIGDVENILIDLQAGRITALVVDSGKFLGIEGELSAIPASAFHFSTDRETLHLDISKDDLVAAPHFKANQWPDFTQSDKLRAIYSAHEVEPYFLSSAATQPQATTGGRQQARTQATTGGSQQASAQTTQGESSEDKAITSAIQKEIRSRETLSASARNVSVVTNKGQTTLSGPVDTAEEKKIIGEIASQNNEEAKVENLLQVKAAKARTE